MSRGTKSVLAATFSLAVLLGAGVASAECSAKHSASTTQTPATDTNTTGGQTLKPTRG